jgi:hypothetical protein
MQIDEVNTRKERKKFLKGKIFSPTALNIPTNSKNSENNIISQKEQVLKRRNKYF